jgi:hypothetical protein
VTTEVSPWAGLELILRVAQDETLRGVYPEPESKILRGIYPADNAGLRMTEGRRAHGDSREGATRQAGEGLRMPLTGLSFLSGFLSLSS